MVESASNPVYKKNRAKTTIKNGSPRLAGLLNSILSNTTFLIVIIGFFTARVSILNMIAPFGIGFFSSVYITCGRKTASVAGMSIVVGMLTNIGQYTIQSVVCMMLIFSALSVFKVNSRTPVIKAWMLAFGVNFVVSLAANLIGNGTLILQDTLIGLFNSVIIIALIYIYKYCIEIIIGGRRRNLLSSEETICLSILCALVISGFSDISIYNISLKVVLSVLVIAISAFARGSGFGAAVGATIGLITSISANQVPAVIGTYAFCGLICGVFGNMGKAGGCLGFGVADVVMHFYLNGQANVIGFGELAVGLLLFVLFPSPIIEKVLPFLDGKPNDEFLRQPYVERIKDMINFRIMNINDVFLELSRALTEDESNARIRQNAEINGVINSVVDRVCAGCDARDICWKRDFYKTYQNIFEMVDVIQSDGKVDMETMPRGLKDKCLRVNQLLKFANYTFDLYKVNYKWKQKAGEAKRVVSEQLRGVSGILSGISAEIKQEVHFESDIEKEIAVALDSEGMSFDDITVVLDGSGRVEVSIYKKACLGRRECIKDYVPAVAKALKKKMKRDSAPCMIKEGTNICCFKMMEAVRYQFSTGIARDIKDEGGLSGDNYSFVELNNGRYMMALSDGMGTGPSAAIESNSAITLLEKYLEAGFDRDIALKSINSAMSLKSPDDNYTTMDLCLTDLYTGEAEFIKIGAASTFIKRFDGTCESIYSTTLPIGILSDIDIEPKLVQLSHGDIVVMITDGVEEAGGSGDENWVISALQEIESRNPQQVAEELLAKAVEKNNGVKRDDMTVLVSKIWEVM